MIQTTAKIISNQKLTPKYYRMNLTCPQIAKESLPGQFIHVHICSKDVFLRRPFSIYKATAKNMEILYKIVGLGTEVLAARKKNQTLNIIGPLGNGYKIPPIRNTGYGRRTTDDGVIILVAGGTGVASLFFLAQKLKINGYKNITVLIGAKTKNELVNIKEFKQLGVEVKIATDDGSAGYKGLASNLLHKVLGVAYKSRNTLPKRFGGQADDGIRTTEIYACGPKPMLKEIASISKIHKIPCQVSLEEHMACGVGACMGCVVKIPATKHGGSAKTFGGKNLSGKFEYQRVCKEGPVFDTQEVVWE